MSEPNLTPAFARHRRRRARSVNRTPRCGPLCRIRVDQQPPNLLRQLIRRPIQPVDVDEDLVRASIPQAHLEALRSTPVVCCPVEPETSRKFVVMDGRQNQTTRRSSRHFPRVVLRNSLDLTLVCSRLKDERAIHRHLDAPLPLDAAAVLPVALDFMRGRASPLIRPHLSAARGGRWLARWDDGSDLATAKPHRTRLR